MHYIEAVAIEYFFHYIYFVNCDFFFRYRYIYWNYIFRHRWYVCNNAISLQFGWSIQWKCSGYIECRIRKIRCCDHCDFFNGCFGIWSWSNNCKYNNYFKFQKILFWKEERIPSDLFTSYNKAILFRSAFNLEICYQMILKERQHHFIFHSQKYLQWSDLFHISTCVKEISSFLGFLVLSIHTYIISQILITSSYHLMTSI